MNAVNRVQRVVSALGCALVFVALGQWSRAQPQEYYPIAIQPEERIDCWAIEIQCNDDIILAALWWQPGEPSDPAGAPGSDGVPRGFRLSLQRVDRAGQIVAESDEVSVPSPLISRRSFEPPVFTGSVSVDPDLRTLVVVVGESSGAHLSAVASEFTVHVGDATGAVEVVKREDRLGEYRGASIATGLADGKRPLIASVERVDDEIVLGIAPWQPGEERALNPVATRRARLTADFREIIAVEPIPEAPPPADQPADPLPSDPPTPPSEPE